jgi:hypothetical protein
MLTEQPVQPEVPTASPRRVWRAWLIAAVVAVAAGGSAVMFLSGDDDATVEVAEDFIAAWFAHDVDAIFANYADDGLFFQQELDEPARDYAAFIIALGDKIASSEPCVLTNSNSVECRIVNYDDLTGPAGITWDSTWTFIVEGGEIRGMTKVGNSSTFGTSDRARFFTGIGNWVQSSHPDIWTETFALAESCSGDFNCWGNWRMTAETAAALLALGPEFIAQSDTYPLDN